MEAISITKYTNFTLDPTYMVRMSIQQVFQNIANSFSLHPVYHKLYAERCLASLQPFIKSLVSLDSIFEDIQSVETVQYVKSCISHRQSMASLNKILGTMNGEIQQYRSAHRELFVLKHCCFMSEEYEYNPLRKLLLTKTNTFPSIPQRFPQTSTEFYEQWSGDWEPGLAPFILSSIEKVKNISIEHNEMDIEGLEVKKHLSKKSGLQRVDKYKKKAIPKAVRKSSWLTYMGKVYEAPCYCCKTTLITCDSFHAGHVVAEKNGGLPTVDNIRPVCPGCNGSMGTKNMHEFIQEYFSSV